MELKFNHANLSEGNDAPPEKYEELIAKPGPFYQQRVIRYEPPRVLSWTWDGGIDGPSEVTFELTPQGDKVLFVLTHRRLANRYRRSRKALAGNFRISVRPKGAPNQHKQHRFWATLTEIEGEYEKRLPRNDKRD